MSNDEECIQESIRQCYDCSHTVIIICQNETKEIRLDKEDALKCDSYIEFSNNHGRINYSKYTFKEKILDNHDNLILISDVEKVFTDEITHGFDD